jgi:uncharacterized membrane protein YfcA
MLPTEMPLGEIASFAAGVAVAGAVSGVLAGVFGIGGGAVLVPVFYQAMTALGVDEAVRMHVAVASSLAIIIPTSLRSFRGTTPAASSTWRCCAASSCRCRSA